MEKTYNPEVIESKWYQIWEASNAFAPNNSKTPYCIMLPPPNVTGSLHMGHAFQDTIMDALIRYHRMKGHNTLWQGGTDHAGIATQMVVERQLLQQNITRHDLGREAFIDKIWEWKAHSGNTITQQMRRLGASIDWSRERFTMDAGLSKAVHEVFINLYEEGLIYRGNRLVNWDPVLHTAVSDLEVISEEEEGSLWYLKYPIRDRRNEYMIVATTRPETMLGDVAVAIHPDDIRYKHLIGQQIDLPLAGRYIDIIADEYVDPEFGTGCVKITPAHDFNDYEIGKRHNLKMINILTEDAKINENAPEQYQGLDRFEARSKVVDAFKQLGLLEKIEPHKLKVPRGDRSGAILEPYLTPQWYVKTEPLAKPAIEAVESGKIKFVPENYSKTYFEWMHNIQDWCISRQLWWGHRIPAWYDDRGNCYVGHNEEEIRSKYHIDASVGLAQDSDVLDTWFSSALWPFSTLGWPEKTPELKTFYPTNVLVTGFDIIFFWVARMIMMGLKFTNKVPFHTVFVHGLIQDPDGNKMSKSKGNVIDPIDVIDGISLKDLLAKRTSALMQPEMAPRVEKDTQKQYPDGIPAFGTDALRFTFCALATTGRHIRFDIHRVEGYRNFCTKLWNAARYVLMKTENESIGNSEADRTFSLPDLWIWSECQQLKQNVEQHIADYRFDLLAASLYDFTWNTYCDWYLELSKPILQEGNYNQVQQNGTRYTLLAILDELLKLMHPIMPFITEEIWQRVNPLLGEAQTESLALAAFPKIDKTKINKNAVASIEFIKQFIAGIRNIRGEMNLSPNKTLNVLCQHGTEQEHHILTENQSLIKALAKCESIEILSQNNKPPASATALAGGLEIFIPMAGLIDKEAELKRLNKEIEKLNKELIKFKAKLENPKFIDKAPQHLVEQERERLNEAETKMAKLNGQVNVISGL